MERKVRLSSRQIGVRLWMFAAVALVFSVLLHGQGAAIGHKEDCCDLVPMSALVPEQPAAGERARHDQFVTHASRVMAIPVSFEMGDIANSTGSDQLFSHRQFNEFLQQEIQSGGETQSF